MSINDTSPSGEGIPVSPALGNATHRVYEQKDYPVNKRVFYLSLLAMGNAVLVGLVAKLLVHLIALITNIAFYGRFSIEDVSPADNHLGLFVIILPVIGGLVIGVMARFGSPAIRGHGIPEAMEQVLTNESRINPVIIFLKPISAAISIGTGGPFGAEGPIISTGGAFGSLTGQLMRVTPNERKIILAAGACAGMSAIFGTPLAAVLLAIELLLFEFSPRSVIPVALSCATGAAMHFILFGTDPVLAMPSIPEPTSMGMVIYICMGLLIGIAAAAVSKSVYFVEDLFEKLPMHWMWWPAVGALAVGAVGYFAPRTLGVGYNNITDLLSGSLPLYAIVSLCFLKFLSWCISLGSGTSGGTLAPLLTIGGATGSLLGLAVIRLWPGAEINIMTCALIGMSAMFAGASRALLTSIVFALECTMQPHAMLPVLAACTASYFISFFLMKGSIMTEKIERRGIATPHALEPDILQQTMVRDVMNANVDVLSADSTIKEAREWIKSNHDTVGQAIAFAIVNPRGGLVGIAERTVLFDKRYPDNMALGELPFKKDHFVYEGSSMKLAARMMSRHDLDMLPVVTHDSERRVTGTLTHKNIMEAYNLREKGEQYQLAISLRQRGIRVIVKGRQMMGR